MVVVCKLCGRSFKTAQGRRGHLNFYHSLAKETPIIKAIRWKIDRHNAGVKMLEEEEIKNRKRREERREKAIGVLREYERSMAESEDIGFIVAKEKTTEDDKFIDKVDFE